MSLLNELRMCFEEDFTKWLLKSNNPKVGPHLSEELYTSSWRCLKSRWR